MNIYKYIYVFIDFLIMVKMVDISNEWLSLHYEDIKEGLGFGYSDDWVKDNGEDMTVGEITTLKRECVKRFRGLVE